MARPRGSPACSNLDLAALDVPLHDPWDAPNAAALDGCTLASWFDANLESTSARAVIEVAVKAIFGAGSGELSLLFALFYLHAGGGLTNLARTTGGAQEARFVGGSQQLADGMAAELGDRVLLGAPVDAVAHFARPRRHDGTPRAPAGRPRRPVSSASADPCLGSARRARHAARAQRSPHLHAGTAGSS